MNNNRNDNFQSGLNPNPNADYQMNRETGLNTRTSLDGSTDPDMRITADREPEADVKTSRETVYEREPDVEVINTRDTVYDRHDGKQIYGVSVGRHEIFPIGDGVNHEFEIEASEGEISLLRELFDDTESAENSLIGRAATPYEPFPEYDQDEKNEPYDSRLVEIYRMLHLLGLPETRIHIEKMGVLDGLDNLPKEPGDNRRY